MSHFAFKCSDLRHPVLLAAGAVLMLAGWADAQTAPPAPNYSSPIADGFGNMATGLPAAVPYEPSWSVDVLLGLPTGVRFQHSLGDDIGRDWLIEGFIGLDFVIFPTLGGGIRRRLTAFRGDHDALVISPGLGAYVLYNSLHDTPWWHDSGGSYTLEMLAVDVDILWQHDFNERCGGCLGLRLGAGPAWAVHSAVLPIASVLFGIRF